VPFRGKTIAWIATRMPDGVCLHTTSDLASEVPVTTYARDVTDRAHVADPLATVVAFSDGDRTMIFVGNSGSQSVTTAASLDTVPRGEHSIRVFSTVWNEWRDLGKLQTRAVLDGIVVVIDAGGFALLDIAPP
jgi:hypothetical protein